MGNRRVVVSGVGIVSCLGASYEAVAAALEAGNSGVEAMPQWAEHGLSSLVAGTLPDLTAMRERVRLPKKLLLGMSDAAQYCALSAADAARDAGLTAAELESERTGCIVGSGIGSAETVHRMGALFYGDRLRRISPYTALRSMSSSASAAVANLLKIRGRSFSISSACATSAHNVGHAFELVRAGVLDRAVAGGGEELHELVTASFQVLRLALSTHYNDSPQRASRPYDVDRDGFVVSGGGGIVVLEELEAARARGATIRAEVVGFGANSDGYDLVLPEPEGRQAGVCMRQAIEDAGLAPADVEYVNTHGTSTVAGDAAEVQAMRRLFQERLPAFSSTKSMTGHSIGAAGVHELIYSVAMIEHGFLAPSINIETLDPVFEGLPIVRQTSRSKPRVVLTNNFGFGGTNAALVLRRYEE